MMRGPSESPAGPEAHRRVERIAAAPDFHVCEVRRITQSLESWECEDMDLVAQEPWIGNPSLAVKHGYTIPNVLQLHLANWRHEGYETRLIINQGVTIGALALSPTEHAS